ncbi:hypothetical protein [Zavarzinella formosa]|uniref:hypothetical protein n=1 Tax=Zavarzinella formosa TaxID=360055 RepID=UPI000303DC7C|nr:hypothetical protein [Zavarzinella formosa]
MCVARVWLGKAALIFAAIAGASPLSAQTPVGNPWGVSSSASGYRDHAAWMPKMAEAGVGTVRLFPEWNGFETPQGKWKWDQADTLVKNAAANKIEINGILMGSPPGAKASHAFPMENLEGWSKYVSEVVGRYEKDVRYWEVWNEGNGGFNDGHHTTADYAKLAIATRTAAKKGNPKAAVGLSVASFDAPYLNQAILSMAKAGKPDNFDFLCIHPYEIADGIDEVDGEIPFLWMSRMLRDMLKTSAPERANAEIWITEVGRRIEKRKDRVVTEQEAARAFVKIYTMALAQGIAKVQWFEAQDPVGEDQGFGLLNRDGSPRASYKMLKAMSASLGLAPKYVGWLAMGKDRKGYGFVFEGKTSPVLVAWMPSGQADKTMSFSGDVEIIDSLGRVASLKADQPFTLTDSPVIVTGIPAEFVSLAKANTGKNFPWGGDYSKAKTVSHKPGTAEPNDGVFLIGQAGSPTVKFPDGSTGIVMKGDIEHSVRFYVHPSFASFQTKEYYVRATVRRLAAGNVGMNLFYEVADSQGRSPYANVGKWFGASADSGWQTHTWHVTNACFSKMWGHDFALRPEQSIPFVLGKVEVSTEPFK